MPRRRFASTDARLRTRSEAAFRDAARTSEEPDSLNDAERSPHSEQQRRILARLDRLPLWPHDKAVLWVVGFGYLMAFFDITNVSFALPVFTKVFGLRPAQEALPITSSLIGYVVGSWIGSVLADLYGRKRGIFSATLLFSIGSVFTAFSFSAGAMVVGRLVTGMGIGAEIAVISAYISEMAPAGLRGRYTAMANVFAMVGLGIVPVVALGLVPQFSWGWRAMFLLGSLGLLTFLALPRLPESPRWLVSKGRCREAESIIEAAEGRARRRTGRPLLPVPDIPPETESRGFPAAALFRRPFRKRMTLLLVLWFVWYLGTYAWLGLGPTFFVERGFSLTRSIVFMLTSSVAFPLGSLLATAIGDRFERQHIILAGLLIWTASFVLIGITDSAAVLYVAVFLLSISNGCYVPLLYALTAESCPTQARATGVALTDGVGHIGGAVGPVIALAAYQWGGIESRFTTVFLFMALSGLITAMLIPFTIKATRRSLSVSTQ